MNNLLLDALNNNNNLIYCYGNILPDLNKIICSTRHINSKDSTQFNMETTNIYNLIKDISKENYKNLFSYNSISHNFSIFKDRNTYIGIGGVSMPGYLMGGRQATFANIGIYKEGLYLLKSEDCELWTKPIKIIDRDWGLKNNCCCFDSQPSLLFDASSNLFYLYCRYNPKTQIRKLQVFITSNIDKWENNAIEVLVNKEISIYTANVFKYQNKFIAIARYYTNIQMFNYNNQRIGILLSTDGINYKFVNETLINDYNVFIHGEIVQGHSIEFNKIIIHLLTINGIINKYEINLLTFKLI